MYNLYDCIFIKHVIFLSQDLMLNLIVPYRIIGKITVAFDSFYLQNGKIAVALDSFYPQSLSDIIYIYIIFSSQDLIVSYSIIWKIIVTFGSFLFCYSCMIFQLLFIFIMHNCPSLLMLICYGLKNIFYALLQVH